MIPLSPVFPSPLQEIHGPLLQPGSVRLWIKRDDLLHPLLSGNKWRKLKYNISAAQQQQKETLLTFGGAYSNHLHAVASAGKLFGFKTIGLVRGEEPAAWGATLRYAKSVGMEVHFLSRMAYRQKRIPPRIDLSGCYILPEGGTNALAVAGCREIVKEVLGQTGGRHPDYWCLPCGTGGTIAGIIDQLSGRGQVLGFSALKGDFMPGLIRDLQKQCYLEPHSNWRIIDEYHFGGYARYRPELIDFMRSFTKDRGIQVDPVYTGKMFYGIFDLISKGYFPEGATVMVVHTGGLQGIAGFEERYGVSLTSKA